MTPTGEPVPIECPASRSGWCLSLLEGNYRCGDGECVYAGQLPIPETDDAGPVPA